MQLQNTRDASTVNKTKCQCKFYHQQYWINNRKYIDSEVVLVLSIAANLTQKFFAVHR